MSCSRRVYAFFPVLVAGQFEEKIRFDVGVRVVWSLYLRSTGGEVEGRPAPGVFAYKWHSTKLLRCCNADPLRRVVGVLLVGGWWWVVGEAFGTTAVTMDGMG
jgi:hypothetical protein